MCIPLIAAKQRLGEHVSAVTNIHNNRELLDAYAVRVLSKESLWVCVSSYRC
jgi:hypothetical protein